MKARKQLRDEMKHVLTEMSKFTIDQGFEAVLAAGVVDEDFFMELGRQKVRDMVRDIAKSIVDPKGRRAYHQLTFLTEEGQEEVAYADVGRYFRKPEDFREPLKRYEKSLASTKKAMRDLLEIAQEVLSKEQYGQLYFEFSYLDEIPSEDEAVGVN